MSDEERDHWDERYRSGGYQPRSSVGAFLEQWIPSFPLGRALDIACGTGRNAMRLAEAGHTVDAIDISTVGIGIAREEAAKRKLDINWINADLDQYALEPATYDLITVIRFVDSGLWARIADALTPNGWLLVEHHMQTDLEVRGPSSPDFRLAPQELLGAFAGLRIVYYEESFEPSDHAVNPGDGSYAIARMVACNGNPGF